LGARFDDVLEVAPASHEAIGPVARLHEIGAEETLERSDRLAVRLDELLLEPGFDAETDDVVRGHGISFRGRYRDSTRTLPGMNPTPFSVLLSRIRASDGTATLDVPDDWLQGRTLFGALQAIIGLAAMRTVAPPAPLRSLQVTFLAPVPGGPVRATANVLRS